MSEDEPTATALAGSPETWLATLRDCFRHVRSSSPARAALVEWLAENAAPEATSTADENVPADEETPEEVLAFFEAVGLLDPSAEGSSLGACGREYLDTHDESVVYRCLAESMPGLEALTEVLAIRPVTDVEIADLLERELDSDVNPTVYRQWLQALGYAEYDDGVSDLTDRGRRLVDSEETLSDGAAERLPSTRAAEAAESAVEDAISVSDARVQPPEQEAQIPSPPSAQDADRNPSDRSSSDSGESSSGLPGRHDYRCMVCGDRRQRGPQTGYADIHYLMPPAEGGPVEAENAVVVCPNHRADFEHGLLRVDPQSLTIQHAYEADVSGRTLRTVEDHTVGAQYLAYHNDVLAEF